MTIDAKGYLTIDPEAMMGASLISFQSGGKVALAINSDGTITTGEGYTPTEAGTEAINAMRAQLAYLFDREREACAKIAEANTPLGGEDKYGGYDAACTSIAAAIRARKGTPA